MAVIVRHIHRVFVNDRLVKFIAFHLNHNNLSRFHLGTASSDGSVRSVVTNASGPPLATSFLSTLGSNSSASVPPPISTPPAVPASSSHYTRVELSNVHFVHSLTLLEYIVCSKQARKLLFPLPITTDKQSKLSREKTKHLFYSRVNLVQVKDILRVFIQIMFASSSGSKNSSFV